MGGSGVKEFSKGDKYKDKHGIVVIMAYVDGYVLSRRPRCTPFVKSRKEFLSKFVKVESLK